MRKQGYTAGNGAFAPARLRSHRRHRSSSRQEECSPVPPPPRERCRGRHCSRRVEEAEDRPEVEEKAEVQQA